MLSRARQTGLSLVICLEFSLDIILQVAYLKYMVCLAENSHKNSACREQSKSYLECRMEKNLMAKEDLGKLGFSDMVEPGNSDNVNKS